MALQVKELALSLLWLRSLLAYPLDPQPRNFHMLQARPEKKDTFQRTYSDKKEDRKAYEVFWQQRDSKELQKRKINFTRHHFVPFQVI